MSRSGPPCDDAAPVVLSTTPTWISAHAAVLMQMAPVAIAHSSGSRLRVLDAFKASSNEVIDAG